MNSSQLEALDTEAAAAYVRNGHADHRPRPGLGIRCGHCHGRHATVADIHECWQQEMYWHYEAEALAGEVYAEAVMSWVASGGNPADASRYASVVARGETWDGGIDPVEFSGRQCEHGLAIELCADPVNHYPPDAYDD